MQPSQEKSFAPPPPVYSIPPRSSSIPLWGKIFIGCGILLVLFVVLIGFGLSRAILGSRGALQTQFCFQNLKTAQVGLQMYSQDYDGKLPPATAWMDLSAPYIKSGTELRCPIVKVANPKGFGYAFNSKLSGSNLSKILAPETTAEVYDSTDILPNVSDALASLPSPARHAAPRMKSAANGPKRGNLIVYADGHISIVGLDGTATDISKLNIRRTLFNRPKKK